MGTPSAAPVRKHVVRKRVPVDATLREQFTCCGKRTCRRCGGVAFTHGPYWFAEWRDDERYTRTLYVGAHLPPELAPDAVAAARRTRRRFIEWAVVRYQKAARAPRQRPRSRT